MRVARMISRLPPARGGKEIHGAQLSRELAELGVRQTVFARVGDPIDPRVRLVRMRAPFAADSRRNLAAFGAWSAQRIVRWHRADPFDLLHVHGDFVEATAAVGAAAACRIPAVMTIHADLGPVPWHDALRRRTFSRMRTIWAVSSGAADAVRGIGVATEVLVRPSGVRDAFFEVASRPRTGGVVTVGRLAPLKGIEHLIAAYDLAAARLGVPWTVIAGGTGAYADAMRSEIAKRPGLECIEETDDRRLAARLAAANVFVLPSVDRGPLREGTPTALLEAIATRTPVVAARSGGVASVLGDGSAGILVPPADPGALAAAIVQAVEDPAAAAERTERAHGSGIARPWSQVAREVADRYAAVVDRSAP